MGRLGGSAPDADAGNERIRRYEEVVASNLAGNPPSDGTAYRALTRGDCARLWGPDCPDVQGMSRKAILARIRVATQRGY